MNYPLISEYKDAILSAEHNFSQLTHLRPVLDAMGNPVMSSGNFAVVFKMKDASSNRFYAVKCFLREQEQRAAHYSLIAEELQYVSSPYLLHMRYLERELFVSSNSCTEEEFPVIVMDWVEGLPLDKYLKNHLSNTYELQMLAYRFCKMGAWLLSQPFAHGDLKPDNILVRADGNLVLVDYDGMFVPAMAGRPAYELGSPDFRHPLRTESTFDEHIDDFAIATIALSLKVCAVNPALYHQYAAADRLLLSTADYHDIGKSAAMQSIVEFASDAELSTLLGVFYLALSKNTLGNLFFRTLLLQEPKIPSLSTAITAEEKATAITDEYGAEYTADGLKLIRVPEDLQSYEIKEGTKVIADGVFIHRSGSHLKSITIPNSVASIGGGVFNECENLNSVILKTSKFYVQSNILFSSNGTVISCWSKESNIILPDDVVTIGDSAFERCSSLKSITIPNSVTSIGDSAFRWCDSLKSITIPNSVISIGNSAFLLCKSLESITIPVNVTSIGDSAFDCCISLKSITIPDSITSIGDWAFDCCISLKSITIPNSVTSIGDRTFFACESLESITIPNSVTSIGDSAFGGCYSLESITIPNSVVSIGGGVFNECENLNSVILKTANFYVQSNILFSSNGRVISCWSKESNIILPDDVVTIGDSAFERCSSLKSITIPNSVTSIGDSAFRWCDSLKSITIPNSIKSIGDSAFCGCKSLKSITIPDSVTSIGYRAFGECKSLKSITIPDSITSIGDWAFMSCKTLKSIIIPNNVTSIGNKAFYECGSLESITIPERVTSIGEMVFWCCSPRRKIFVPKGSKERMLKLLGQKYEDKIVEFYSNPNSTTVTAEERTTAITDEYGAEYTADGLKLISVPDTLESYEIRKGTKVIADWAFINLFGSHLESITIPDSVISIGGGVFNECENLNSVILKTANFYVQSNILFSSNGRVISCWSNESNIVLPDDIITIGDSAFEGCSSLKSITIPDSVTSIGDRVFCRCDSLQSITIPNSIKSIGDSAFCGCDSLQSITIPDSVTSIGKRVFIWCNSLESITIPDSIISIGGGVFNGCKNLNSVILKTSKFYVQSNILFSSNGRVISCWSKESNIILPDDVIRIEDCAFEGCESLKSIIIPDSVTKIENCAFYWCSSLKSITIPDSVTSIGNSAFEACESLESITIPDSVTSIGESAFEGCYSLQSITIPNSITSIGDSAFCGCKTLKSITIPDSVTSIGDSAFERCESLESITIPNSVISIGKWGNYIRATLILSNQKEKVYQLSHLFF